MAKGAVSIVAGYWPEDVYRYLQVPGLSLDEAVIARPARRRAEHPALVVGAETLVYRALGEDVGRAATRLRAVLGADGQRVALAVSQPLELVRSFFGALRAGCVVLLLDAAAPAGDLRAHLASFRPDLVVADEPALAATPRGPDVPWRTVEIADVWGMPADGANSRPQSDLRAPAVALVGADGRLVYHSHASLLAWAVSWSAFVPVTEETTLLSFEPFHGWGGLAATLAALFRGGTCRFAVSEAGADGQSLEQALPMAPATSNTYALAPFATIAALADSRGRRLRDAIPRGLAGVFTTVEGPFGITARRRAEAALGVPVLTVLGNAGAGPAIACHPSWYLDEAVGIPLTNVDLWPLDPSTGRPLAVPWDAIEFGELGVRSPMTAVDFQSPDDRETRVRDGWLRLRVTATMDPNGLFYLRA